MSPLHDVCVVISFILDVGLVDAPSEVTQQEEDHTRLHATTVLFFITTVFTSNNVPGHYQSFLGNLLLLLAAATVLSIPPTIDAPSPEGRS